MIDLQTIINQFRQHGVDEGRILIQIAKLQPVQKEVNIL
jgi:hypothetical protein